MLYCYMVAVWYTPIMRAVRSHRIVAVLQMQGNSVAILRQAPWSDTL
jgi:hypothetical protein